MTDYSIKTDIEKEKNEDLFLQLKTLIDKGQLSFTIEDVERKVKSVKTDWNTDHIIKTLFDEIETIINYTIKTYEISETFKALNHEDYSLIRDGFITIGAEANAGKSSLLTALSIDILNNNKDTVFIFYSLDDSNLLSGKRILSQITERNQFKESTFQRSLLDKDKEQEYDRLFKKIIIKERFNINTFEMEVEKIKEYCGCKKVIIGIDYLQIIQNNTGNIQREFYNYIVKELKEIQKRLESDGCMLFLLSQFNRDTKSTSFRYRETSEIENQSDVCLDILSDEQNKESLERYIKVSKNKLGKKGRIFQTKINGNFNFDKLEIKNTNLNEKKQKIKNKEEQPNIF